VGIPIVAVVDTNSNPEGIDYPIPGNDDAIRAINLFTSIIAQAVIEADNEIGLEVIESLQEDERTEGEPAPEAEEAPESVEASDESEEETVPLAAVAEADASSESEEEKEEETYTAEDYSDYQPEEENEETDERTREEYVAEQSGYNEEDLYEQDEE
jgi:small subunit ribosomal protein S2